MPRGLPAQDLPPAGLVAARGGINAGSLENRLHGAYDGECRYRLRSHDYNPNTRACFWCHLRCNIQTRAVSPLVKTSKPTFGRDLKPVAASKSYNYTSRTPHCRFALEQPPRWPAHRNLWVTVNGSLRGTKLFIDEAGVCVLIEFKCTLSAASLSQLACVATLCDRAVKGGYQRTPRAVTKEQNLSPGVPHEYS